MQDLGPLDILAVWIASILLLKQRFNGNTGLTISEYAALEGYSHVPYALIQVIVAVSFYWFILSWFIPTLSLASWYNIVAIIGLTGLATAGIVPEKPGIKYKIHRIGAYTMAFCMYLMVLGIALSGSLPQWLTLFTYLASAVMTFGIGAMIFAKKRLEGYILYYQSAYIGLFHLIIILTTYFHS